MNFSEKVLEVVRKIPKGETLSYKEVARMAGNERAARVVGSVMKKNYDPSVPCHRVIKSDGTLGQYNRGEARKVQLLRMEGAVVKDEQDVSSSRSHSSLDKLA